MEPLMAPRKVCAHAPKGSANARVSSSAAVPRILRKLRRLRYFMRVSSRRKNQGKDVLFAFRKRVVIGCETALAQNAHKAGLSICLGIYYKDGIGVCGVPFTNIVTVHLKKQ